MWSVPAFVDGPLHNAMRVALEEDIVGQEIGDALRQKLEGHSSIVFQDVPAPQTPRMLDQERDKMFEAFASLRWVEVSVASVECAEDGATVARHRQRMQMQCDFERGAANHDMLCPSWAKRVLVAKPLRVPM